MGDIAVGDITQGRCRRVLELVQDLPASGEVGAAAIKVAQEHCPGGFRLVSNFGYDGMQSQEHAHVHVLGGMFLGEYA